MGCYREYTELGQMETAPFPCSTQHEQEKGKFWFIFKHALNLFFLSFFFS